MKNPAAIDVFDSMKAAKEALAGSTLVKFKTLIENPEATPEEFLAILPATSVVAIQFASGKMPKDAPEFIQRDIKPLKELISKEIPNLKTSASFAKAVAVAIKSIGGLSQKPDANSDQNVKPRSIAAVSAAPLLFGTSEPLVPVLRIVLQSDPPGENYEFFASTEELAGLAAAFVQNLAQMLEQRASLARKGVVRILAPSAISEAIHALELHLQKFKQIAPDFGITLNIPTKNVPPSDAAD